MKNLSLDRGVNFVLYGGVRRVVSILLVFFWGYVFCGQMQAEDFMPVVKSGEIWKDSYTELPDVTSSGHVWVKKNEVLRIPKPQFSLGDLRVGETLFMLKQSIPTHVRIFVYNRGDMQPLERKEFLETLELAKSAVEKGMDITGKLYEPKSQGVVKIKGYTWQGETSDVFLSYSATGASKKDYKGEFIRLDIVPKGKLKSVMPEGSTKESRGSRDSFKENVVKEADGSVYIDHVPMEDQGQKGYCAAATVSRILRYYGNDNVDQHQIAQLAKSDSIKGTSYALMMSAISKVLVSRYSLKCKDLWAGDMKNVELLLKNYNRIAKRDRVPEVKFKGNLGTIWEEFKPEVLKQAMGENKPVVNRWEKLVYPNIDKGIPVIWGVTVGIFPDVDGGGRQRTSKPSGHLRIIIGYNKNTNEIIYTDSWGSGHEHKVMPLAEAVSMTTTLSIIVP